MSPSSISPLHVGTGQLDCQVLQYVRHIQSTGITRRPPRRKIHTEKKHKKVSKNILYYIRVLQMGFFFIPAVSGRSSRPHLTFSPPLNRRRSPASLEITRRDYLKKTETKWSTDI